MTSRKSTIHLLCDETGAIDVEAMRDERSAPTKYTAPDDGQKWRARELFGFTVASPRA